MAKGGFVLSDEDKAKLQAVIWVDGHINAKVVMAVVVVAVVVVVDVVAVVAV